MSETERNLRLRMAKRDALMRQRDPNPDQDWCDVQSTEDASITRNFRYMRRKPTIITYKPPPGDQDEDGNQLLSDVVVDSDHMILDRIQGFPGSSSAASTSAGGAGFESSSHQDSDHQQHSDYHVQNPAQYRHPHYHEHLGHHHHHLHSARVDRAEISVEEPSEKNNNNNSKSEAKLTKPLVVYIDGPFG